MIEIVEADRDYEDYIHLIGADDQRLTRMVKPGCYGYVQCACDPYGGKCPNNPNKELIGSFQLCHIRIQGKDTAHS